MPNAKKVILLIESSRSSGRGLLRGIAKYSCLYGPWEFYRKPPFYFLRESERQELEKLHTWGADGIITREPQKIKTLIATGIPCIVAISMQNPFPGVPMMVSNYEAIGKMAAEHLRSKGFRRFAYCGFEDVDWSVHRKQGFVRHINQAGFEVHLFESPLSRIQKSWEEEKHLLASWLKSLPKPIALMTCNDERSQHVVEACKLSEVLVPNEIAILGVDDDEMICEFSIPTLSSIALNEERAGYEAAELLDRLMKGEKINNQTIVVEPLHVVTRQSTDIMAIENKEVATAVSYIQKHSREVIQVMDVVEAAATSRRSLERLFRRFLGRSIHDEIRRSRVEQIVRLLVETNDSVLRIALSLGFPGVEQLDRYFHQAKGMSPLAYRKKYGRK